MIESVHELILSDSFVFDTRGTGAYMNQTNTWELLAWGYDTAGVGYILVYETAVQGEAPPNIDIEGREWGHPTLETRETLLGAVRAFGRPELTNLTRQVVELPHDGRRDVLPSYSCDRACVENMALAKAIAMLEREIEECGGGS